jgi:hypothetical protein
LETTDISGRALLTAPEITQTQAYTVIAEKEGYAAGAETRITIIALSSSSLYDDLTAMAPIIAAILILLVAMVVVHIRKQSSRPSFRKVRPRKRGVFHHKYIEEYPYSRDEGTTGHREPVIEEVRLRKTRVVSKEGSLPSSNQSSKSLNIPREQWFHGTDDIRFKIDRITGKIDDDGKDKWCDGHDDIEKKIDKALSKQTKKKQGKTSEK